MKEAVPHGGGGEKWWLLVRTTQKSLPEGGSWTEGRGSIMERMVKGSECRERVWISGSAPTQKRLADHAEEQGTAERVKIPEESAQASFHSVLR